MKTLSLAMVLTALVAATATPALASDSAPAKERPALRASAEVEQAIARQKASTPRAFEAFRAVRDEVPAADAKKRGRLAVLGPRFAALGPSALYPMLEALLGPEPQGFTPEARVALRAGMLEAVAKLRSPHGAAVATAVLAAESDPDVVRAAAEVLARMMTDEHTKTLEPLVAQGDRRVPVIEGMSSCRTLRGARILVAVVDDGADARATKAAMDSLGKLGSTWAWSTPELRPRAAEGDAIRAEATRALEAAKRRSAARARTDAAAAEIDAAATAALASLR